MATRLFCGFLSILLSLIDDHTLTIDYGFLTNRNIEVENVNDHKIVMFVIAFNLIFIVIVQIKIEIFKKSVDGIDIDEVYNKITSRIVFSIISLTILINMYWLIIVRLDENPLLSRLWVNVLVHFFVTNLVPLILIYRNEKMYKFCMIQIGNFCYVGLYTFYKCLFYVNNFEDYKLKIKNVVNEIQQDQYRVFTIRIFENSNKEDIVRENMAQAASI